MSDMTGGHSLEVQGLRKLYGRKCAVEEASFTMSTGEITGLLGPNGAGKTTVFYMISLCAFVSLC